METYVCCKNDLLERNAIVMLNCKFTVNIFVLRHAKALTGLLQNISDIKP
jgi:hypothetical protein